jgi:phosphogluconate dehydratase
MPGWQFSKSACSIATSIAEVSRQIDSKPTNPMSLHPVVARVTDRVRARSATTRAHYLDTVAASRQAGVARGAISCTNLAHAMAAHPSHEKLVLREAHRPNVAVVTSYNDMLSAHQPYADYPALIKRALQGAGAVGQVAGGVPAMCDGVTQGQPGMELSLFSRDVIAMSTAVALSHGVFDAALCLGVCDKIVPGLLIGALHFGHLPVIFVPAGPMRTGLANDEKAKVRQLHAKGLVDRSALLEAESRAYHGAGTCTFYGTANSNQLLMEVMGLHLPGAAFVPPDTPLRAALTEAAAVRVASLTAQGSEYTPLAEVVDERCIVNAIVALLATGGSTNHTIHLVAMARAAGIIIDWDDFDTLSQAVPLLTRIYPNGTADINHFHAAGGMGTLIGDMLTEGLLHADVNTVAGPGLARYAEEPVLRDDEPLTWRAAPARSVDSGVLRPVADPFSPDSGLRMLSGNLGRAVIKVSAVKPQHRRVEAPAVVFASQAEFMQRYKAGELDRDFVAVLRFQGPKANGMPELHQLTPALATLQDKGRAVALVTDGRMSGASGKVPAAIHITPEALGNGPIGKVRDGDIVLLDADHGTLHVHVPAGEWAARPLAAVPDLGQRGMGRELFTAARAAAGTAEEGACSFGWPAIPPFEGTAHEAR